MKQIYPLIFSVISLSFASKAQWNPAASMGTTRGEHISTVLQDGSVLVAGGWDGSTNLKTAEIYDPVNDIWNATATQMSSAHTWGAAVTLANGKVLAIGGYTGSVNTTACDLYDPVADTWTATGSLTTGRSWFTATLLNNGKVLVAGGYNPSANFQVANAELYDPVAGTWSPGGTLGIPRSYHSGLLLNNGKVLVAGGLGTDFSGLNQLQSTEIYDPALNTWSPAADMNDRRDFFGMTKLADGTVMAGGGRYYVSGSNYIGITGVEIYDPVGDVWTPSTPLPTKVCYNELIALNDGTVLSIAGLDSLHNASPFVTVKGITYVSDISFSSWTAAPPANDGRFEFCGNLMNDGRVLLSGGNDNSAELYGIASGVSQISNAQSLVIYPNPAKDELRVMSDELWVNPTLELTNILGESIYRTQLKTQNSQLNTTIDVSGLNAGIYFVKIQDSQQTFTGKLIVSN